MSEFDRKNIGVILSGHGDWFGAQLLRLICKADLSNRERIRRGFPEEVGAYESWERENTV